MMTRLRNAGYWAALYLMFACVMLLLWLYPDEFTTIWDDE